MRTERVWGAAACRGGGAGAPSKWRWLARRSSSMGPELANFAVKSGQNVKLAKVAKLARTPTMVLSQREGRWAEPALKGQSKVRGEAEAAVGPQQRAAMRELRPRGEMASMLRLCNNVARTGLTRHNKDTWLLGLCRYFLT